MKRERKREGEGNERGREGEGNGEGEGGRQKFCDAFTSLLTVCNYTQWSTWSECSKTCNTGVRTRYRESHSPPTVPELCNHYSETTGCRLISCSKCTHVPLSLTNQTPPTSFFSILRQSEEDRKKLKTKKLKIAGPL